VKSDEKNIRMKNVSIKMPNTTKQTEIEENY